MKPQDSRIDVGALTAEERRKWLRDEFAFAWRSAQDEAVRAYRVWCASPGRTAYAAYRAAQDRADQAQDVLAGRLTSEEQKARTRR